MNKTNVTSIQPLSWIPSRVGQCMQWMLAGLMLFLTTTSSVAQGPNCTDVNASIDFNGYANIAVSEFVTNCATVAPVNYVVYNQYGGVVAAVDGAICATVISVYACNALGQTYTVNFSNASGACWSNLTFKQSNGPIVPDTTKYLYCLDPHR